MAGVTTDVCLVYPTISACREGYQEQALWTLQDRHTNFPRYVAAAHGTRGSSAYRNKHADGRTRAGLESARRRPIAWHTVSRRIHRSPNKALHRHSAIPLRSIAAGERRVSRNHMGTAVTTKGTRLDMIFL